MLSARTWVELPPETRPAFAAELAESHGIAVAEAPAAPVEEVREHPYLNLLREGLAARVDPGQAVHVSEEPEGRFHADVPMAGRVLRFSFSKDLFARPLHAVGWTIAVVLLVTLAIAWRLAKRVTAPVARLAAAARQIGAGENPRPLPESGDRELADLARAFNDTASQLAAQRENQATFLAGLSHDLRTPLGRLRMALGMLGEERDSPLIARMEGDITEMDALVGAQLALARARQAESVADTDVDAVLAERGAAAGGAAHLRKSGVGCRAIVAPMALRRIVANLVDNAVKHGGPGAVQIVRRRCRGAIVVGVRDRGPGIPPAMREAVFQPFFRLEPSRNRATGGSGLGLAIARQLADTHGWRLAIKPRRGGGTSVWLAIPAPLPVGRHVP
jgi:two-component system osmolarity sensor histidine kinase EnvZ